MLKYFLDFLLSNSRAYLLVYTSDKDSMICSEFFDKLFLRCKLSATHFIAKANQKSVSQKRVDYRQQ